MAEFNYNGTQVHYTETGTGTPLLLLHGYLETRNVFANFATQLAENFRVIMPDIPGHGQSGVLAEIHSVELLAEIMNALLTHLQVEKCLVAGHSMGGYVALAFARLYNVRTTGIVLIHSSLYADSDEKKSSRLLEINKIASGLKAEIFKTNIPKMFALDNVIKFNTVIQQIIEQAHSHSEEGICALLRGMIHRPDCQLFWKNWKKPSLMIFGLKDQYIASEVASRMAEINPKSDIVWLSESGHMGFIEQEQRVVEVMNKFKNGIEK